MSIILYGQDIPAVLDVSLRDGGYLNEWRFSASEVDHVIRTVSAAGVDFVEVGYLDDKPGLPEAASCHPEMLQRVRLLAGNVAIVAMARPGLEQPDAVLKRRAGLVDLVRIPTDLRNPAPAIGLARSCRRNGFAVSLNFTSVSCFGSADLRKAAAAASGEVDAIYLADSRGALDPEDVPIVVQAVRSAWNGPIGFHAHDNLGLATENTRIADSLGCELLDGSIAGVGLGGRNTRLDAVLQIASRRRPGVDAAAGILDGSIHDLGLQEAGDERALYRQAAIANIRQEWVETLTDQLGFSQTLEFISALPRQAWMEYRELGPFLARWHAEVANR